MSFKYLIKGLFLYKMISLHFSIKKIPNNFKKDINQQKQKQKQKQKKILKKKQDINLIRLICMLYILINMIVIKYQNNKDNSTYNKLQFIEKIYRNYKILTPISLIDQQNKNFISRDLNNYYDEDSYFNYKLTRLILLPAYILGNKKLLKTMDQRIKI